MGQDCTFIIFGAAGNLSRIKIMPALYHLEQAGKLTKGLRIIACGRQDWSNDTYIEKIQTWVAEKARGIVDDHVLKKFSAHIEYFKGDLEDQTMYARLSAHLEHHHIKNMAFYMAIKPQDFAAVIDRLSKHQLLNESHGWRRVVIEKPFGYDLKSAQTLQKQISSRLEERQVFRIDHYLAKGMVQNVLVFRFANLLMEPLWNRNYIDHIQITHSECVGIGKRGNYYDQSGALRDMIQSHLMQLLTLIAMEAPVSMAAEDMRDEKVKILKSIRPIAQNQVHAYAYRAQYGAGKIEGKTACAYTQEEGIPDNSVTETYAALKLYIDNWRWHGVPFYIRTGKRMQETQSMISICFKQPPQHFFQGTGVDTASHNWLILGIQPEECLHLEMTVKEPGLEMRTRTTSLDAGFRSSGEKMTDAYEDLLLDVIEGDQSLFLRWDEIEWAWRIVDPVLKVWTTEDKHIDSYQAGTWGPINSRRLFHHEGLRWRHSINLDYKDST
ncbi:MAG: glucose-6-phosphate dehydrogenase [Pseudomonadales bacterium]